MEQNRKLHEKVLLEKEIAYLTGLIKNHNKGKSGQSNQPVRDKFHYTKAKAEGGPHSSKNTFQWVAKKPSQAAAVAVPQPSTCSDFRRAATSSMGRNPAVHAPKASTASRTKSNSGSQSTNHESIIHNGTNLPVNASATASLLSTSTTCKKVASRSAQYVSSAYRLHKVASKENPGTQVPVLASYSFSSTNGGTKTFTKQEPKQQDDMSKRKNRTYTRSQSCSVSNRPKPINSIKTLNTIDTKTFNKVPSPLGMVPIKPKTPTDKITVHRSSKKLVNKYIPKKKKIIVRTANKLVNQYVGINDQADEYSGDRGVKHSTYKYVKPKPQNCRKPAAAHGSVFRFPVVDRYRICRPMGVSNMPTTPAAHRWSAEHILGSPHLTSTPILSLCSDLFLRRQLRNARITQESDGQRKTASRAPAKRLVVLGGIVYSSTKTKLARRQSTALNKKRQNRSLVIRKLSPCKMKTLHVRGVRFQVGRSGKTLKRLQTPHQATPSTSKVNVSNVGMTPTRLDIGGITYVQTGPGTFVRRSVTSHKIIAHKVHRSIAAVQNSHRKKVSRQEKRYCIFFNRFGKCHKGDACKFIHDPEKVAVCTRFLRGTCRLVDCPFLHKISKDKMPVCSFFLRGLCNNDNCPYLHVNVNKKAQVCEDFVRGVCELGAQCKKKHVLVCSEYAEKGNCSKGNGCKLRHIKKRAKKRKLRNEKPETKATKIRSPAIVPPKSYQTSTDVAFPSTSRAKPARLPSYIALDSSSPKNQTLNSGVAEELQIKPKFLED